MLPYRWLGLAAALCLTAPALAVTDTTANMAVTATIVTTCTIGTPDTLAFGSAITTTASAITAQANIPVTCSNGGSYKVFLNNGSNYASSTRNMASGSNKLAYSLYADSARSTAFPITAAAATAQTGTAAVVSTVVYGTVPSQTTPPVGAYADTVQITVEY